MSANEYVFVSGMKATRSTFELWNRAPWPVLRAWFALSFAIALTLLGAVFAVSSLIQPDYTPVALPGFRHTPTVADMAPILYRNSLVLALHACACVAGFIAGASMPVAAAQRTGFSRWVHVKAGELAIVFVSAVTLFSLATQALFLGFQGSSLAFQLDLSPLQLIISVLPHALPELVALFLPLAAWLVASRRSEWDQLLAATVATVTIAIPMLLVSSAIEVWVWPEILESMSAVDPTNIDPWSVGER